MIAVDTGIASGHLTAADIFFIIAVALAVIAAVLELRPPAKPSAPTALAWLAVACVAFGLFLL